MEFYMHECIFMGQGLYTNAILFDIRLLLRNNASFGVIISKFYLIHLAVHMKHTHIQHNSIHFQTIAVELACFAISIWPNAFRCCHREFPIHADYLLSTKVICEIDRNISPIYLICICIILT